MMIVEYSWVVKVLESCIFEQQVVTSKKLFELFLEKWSDEISSERKTQMVFNFNRLSNGKILDIRKKYYEMSVN